jgi:hypothetical protein
MILMDWKVYSLPYDAFNSSSMIEALLNVPISKSSSRALYVLHVTMSQGWAYLCPLGVPKVNSSIPDVAIKPVGLSEEDIKRVCGTKCLEVW